jgi:transglutaminase-like putative cysteine protease
MKANITAWILPLLAVLIENGAAKPIAGLSDKAREYDVKRIPAALVADADAVVRTDITRFEVKSRSRARLSVKFAVTVFKKEGRQYGKLVLWYDKFEEIEELEGTLYDADGKKVRELGSDEIKDYSGTDGISLAIDWRAHIAELYHDQYPYTVEFVYEYSYDGYLNWPHWWSQGSLDAVELSRFEVLIPEKDSLRYWCNTDTVKPTISTEGSRTLYAWETMNLPKLSKDMVGEDAEDVSTLVRIGPSDFEYGDYRGNLRTWKDFGQWYSDLVKGRDVLPETAVRDVQSLLQPADTMRTRVEKLYHYMQNRTRYVSIQLGIGGWQPFDATFVHDRSYGDCKALSNYMVSLLKEAGITAYPFLIRAGRARYPFINEFPSSQFNHAMVCVPLQNDTVWLECTSQTMPFGHISSQTENRGALLITPAGGVVVHTPATSAGQNMQRRRADVTMKLFGNVEVASVVTRSGDQQDYVRNAVDEATPEERERWVINDLDVPNANLQSFTFEGLDTHSTEISVSTRFAVQRYASTSGDRLFFLPNMMERRTGVPADVARRLSPVRFNFPYLDIDSIRYTLPHGYTPESIPAEVHLAASFGGFRAKTYAIGDTVILYTRTLDIRDYSIPAESYTEYRKFFSDIVKADRAQVVLVKKKW